MCVDTSALMSVVLRESTAQSCAKALAQEREVLISAGTIVEALIVSSGRGVWAEMTALLDGLAPIVVPVDGASARRAAEAHVRFGRGQHPARLNYGDCFAYEVAQRYGCPLLFVGDDFSKTDVRSALG